MTRARKTQHERDQATIARLERKLHELESLLTDGDVCSPEQTQALVEQGWKAGRVDPCSECFGQGCPRCHDVGCVTMLMKGQGQRVGTMIPSPGMVGARCTMHFAQTRLRLNAQGHGGSAVLVFSYRQLYPLLDGLIRCLSNPGAWFQLGEYGVEAEFRGPPAMRLAALTKDRVTVTTFANKRQRAALTLLRKRGYGAEADLLASAFEHELFRGDHAAEQATRDAIGDVEPGTIFQRRGEHAVVGDQVVALDGDRGMSSLLTKK